MVKLESTTVIRPVYDASTKREGFPSLNQCLERGPNLIEVVPNAINRFRGRTIGVIADIRKAFLQISITEKDRDSLRFLWVREDKILVFRHCRVVFGLSCSPFILAAIIKLLLSSAQERAKDSQCDWSEKTVEKLHDAFYVDNCATSLDSETDLKSFVQESTAIFASRGFDLRACESTNDNSEKESTLVLGMLWNKKRDTISINPRTFESEDIQLITKRTILSATHKIFDPIGITCPVALKPKMILRNLWEEKIDWDANIEGKLKQEFLQWSRKIKLLKNVEIPRTIGVGKVTLHTFGDVSGAAYAAVVFARVEWGDSVKVTLLNAKSRVAPKGATIPRLELMAATIGVRLTQTVAE